MYYVYVQCRYIYMCLINPTHIESTVVVVPVVCGIARWRLASWLRLPSSGTCTSRRLSQPSTLRYHSLPQEDAYHTLLPLRTHHVSTPYHPPCRHSLTHHVITPTPYHIMLPLLTTQCYHSLSHHITTPYQYHPSAQYHTKLLFLITPGHRAQDSAA